MARTKTETPTPASCFGWRPLVVILALGCLLRILYLVEIKPSPDFSSPLIDAEFHQYWASAIVTGDWTPPHGQPDPQIRTTPYLRPPGYPYFLATVYRIAGVGFMAPRIAQMLLGLANCVLAYALGRIWYGPGVGFIYAGLMATNWSFIYFESKFLEPSLLILLLLSAVFALGHWMRRGGRRYAVLAGIMLGLAAAARPNVLLLIPVALVWMIRARKARPSRKPMGIDALLLMAGAMLPIAPITVRNALVADDIVLISANAGVNLFIGNNERADGFYFGGLEGVGDFGTCYDYPRLIRTVEREQGHPIKYSEVSRYFARRALNYALSHPIDVLALTIKKAWMFWAPYEISHNYVVTYDREASPVLRHLPFGFPLVSSGFLVGILVCAAGGKRHSAAHPPEIVARRRMTELVLAFSLVYAGSFAPFFNAALYRMPVIPLLMLFVAVAIMKLWQTITARHYRKTAVWGAGWALSYALCAVPWVRYEPDLTEWLHKKGIASSRSGQPSEAVLFYRQALKDTPQNIRIRCALAESLIKMGQGDAAVSEYAKALEYEPENPAVYSDLGNTLRAMGRLEDASRAFAAAVELNADFVAPYFNLANLHTMRGELEKAIEQYRAGLQIDNQSCAGRMGLGLALARAGQSEEGIAQCSEAVRMCPDSVDARMNLGIVLVTAGEAEKAIPHYQHVLRLAPGHPYAHHNLGVAYEKLYRVDDAITSFVRALEVKPDLHLTQRSVGLLLRKLNRPEAIDFLEQVCESDPLDTEALMALGDAFKENGYHDRAAARYRAVLEIEPDNSAAKKAITAMQNN